MISRRWARALLVLAAVTPASAQETTHPGGFDVGLGGGLFAFLNGSRPGGVVQATTRTQGPAHFTASSWLAFPDGPAVAVDAGLLVARRGPHTSPYLRAGGGFLLHSDLKGPGIHVGAGLLTPPGTEPGVRLEGMLHSYTPGGGVPVLSLTLTLLTRWGARGPAPQGNPGPAP